MGFDEVDLDLVEILSDPVMFAEHHLGWKAYPYQAETLRDFTTRKVLRWGRRTGKSDTLAIFAIWWSFTHGMDVDDPNSRPSVILIAAPYENQVKLIFRRVRELIRKSPDIKQSIKGNQETIGTKNPEYIEFKNGSIIAGFTAGTKSGAGGASMRGQRATWIIVDEMDYMNDEDITSIFAIASDKNTEVEDMKEIGIVASSTPTGKRSSFYNFCMNAQDDAQVVFPGRHRSKEVDENGKPLAIWTEFYYPSTSNPNWAKEADKNEREWKAMLGESGYIHEILAEFGTETVGVFNKDYIDRSKRDYKYIITPKRNQDAVRVIGVDWDKYQSTPTFCCLEWCPDEENSDKQKGMFKVINRISLPVAEFTIDNAVETLIEWNHTYQPDWIYVDRGFGEYQVETLHKRGKLAGDNPDDPAYMMNRRVIGIHFGESKEVRDPGTGEMIKKPIKPWMVTQTVILFERDRIIINKKDTEMWKQLENYRVEKISVDGRPTYTSVNEHTVDALMLCALAVAEKMPDYVKFVTKYDPTRVMAIAPPIIKTAMPVKRGVRDINIDDDEYEKAKKSRGQVRSGAEKDHQEWFRVDDIRDTRTIRSIDMPTAKLFKGSPFVPRGLNRKHNKRTSF